MPGGWQTRRTPLPPNWRHTLRPAALKRDGYQCTWTLPDGTLCGWTDPTGRTLEVDHIGDRNDHRLHNLRTLCGRTSPHNHHGHRTAMQGVQAQPRRLRPPEQHPGVLR